MNLEEIIRELKIQEISEHQFASVSKWIDDEEFFKKMDNPLPNIGKWETIHQSGGEGKGYSWELVNHFIDQGVYVKISGHYSSYEGVEFDGDLSKSCKEVKPVTKTVTLYQ